MSPTARKLGLLGSLYLCQGLPYGFFSQALPVLMRQQGYSLQAITLTYILALPWALKFLWAPAVDRFGSRRKGARRSWILPLQLTTVGVLLAISFISSSGALAAMLVGVFVTNILAATQDIATDGLAVDMLEPAERGWANGIQVAGYRVGMILGGGVLLILIGQGTIGWQTSFIVMAAVLALATVPVWRHREKPRRTRARAERGARILAFLRRPTTPRVLLLIIAYKSGDAFAVGVSRPFLVDAGLELSDIGLLLGWYGFWAGLVGALVGGALVNRLGRRRSLVVFGVVQALAVGGWVLLSLVTPTMGLVGVVVALDMFAGGTATAAVFTCMMDWSSPESSATDYTVQASVVAITTGLATMVSGFTADALGYTAHFALGTALTLAAVLVVLRAFPERRGTCLKSMS